MGFTRTRLWSLVLTSWTTLQLFPGIVTSINVHSSQSDSRCFLVNGGSSVSFFVREDASIGTNIGTLQIHGDVNRDIHLSIRGSDRPPVAIEPGSKNITLSKRLDREGVEGPSSVTFTVLCDKRNSNNEPSIHIPVTIRVKDVNDNAPRIIGGPFKINVSEQTLPGSSLLSNIKAIDLDQSGPHSTLTFLALDSHGKPSKLVTFAGGGQEGRLILAKPLDFETHPKFNVTLRVSDQGVPPLHSDTLVEVRVLDADDQNPRFQHVSYSSLITSQNGRAGSPLEVEPEPIHAFDQDTGINAQVLYSIAQGRAESQFFHMDPLMGRITLSRDIPSDALLQPLTLVLKAEQRDNPDRYAISTLNVARKGSPSPHSPLSFVQPEFFVSVPENAPVGSLLFTALTSKRSEGKRLQFGIGGGNSSHFQLGAMGQLILRKALDYESSQRHVLKLWVADGQENATATGIINVINVNDWAPRFRQNMYEFNVSSAKLFRGSAIGQIEVADGDLGDRLSLEIKNSDSVQVDEEGHLYLSGNKTVVKREMMFIVVAKDTGEPPREAFVPVLVRFTDVQVSNSTGDEHIFLHESQVDLKVILLVAFLVTLLALGAGLLLYFGYCRKRRKIETENFHKRVLERNISNPLAIHKLANTQFLNGGTLRRSNKVRQVLNIPNNGYSSDPSQGLTPVDPLSCRQKNVTWSPKLLQRLTPAPPTRSQATRVTTVRVVNGHGPSKGLELDPDTSVTPLETYRNSNNMSRGSHHSHHSSPGSNHSSSNNARNKNNGSDTLQSNNSLTLYF